MTLKVATRPRLSLPFTVIADGEVVHLIGGEDVRYSVRAGNLTGELARLLRRCDGRCCLAELLAEVPEVRRFAVHQLLDRLWGERILLPGPVEESPVSAEYRLQVEGSGPLVERLTQSPSGEKPLAILCQDSLDLRTAQEFNRRCLDEKVAAWMWVTTGPLNRGYVSPVFVANAGPCLACLLRHFQCLSPVPHLYEALMSHSEQGGDFTPAPFPQVGLTILEQLVHWKRDQLRRQPPLPALFRLHVLELESMEVTAHRAFLDPTCPECGNARLV